MKTLTLKDLTKEELIELCQRHLIRVSAEEIGLIIYRRESDKALAEMDAALLQMKSLDLSKPKDQKLYFAADRRWANASKKLNKLEQEREQKTK